MLKLLLLLLRTQTDRSSVSANVAASVEGWEWRAVNLLLVFASTAISDGRRDCSNLRNGANWVGRQQV
jgi:hypothetical protein